MPSVQVGKSTPVSCMMFIFSAGHNVTQEQKELLKYALKIH